MSETDEFQNEKELLQPKLYNTFDYSTSQKKAKDESSRKLNPPPAQAGVDYININDEDQMEIYGYEPNLTKRLLTGTLTILTVFLIRLLFHWKPHWHLLCTHTRCPLERAKKVLLVDHFMQKFTEKVECKSDSTLAYHNGSDRADGSIIVPKPGGHFEHVSSITYFENKKVHYIWNKEQKNFLKVRGLDRDIFCAYFYHQKALLREEQKKRQIIYGLNAIVVKVQSIGEVLFGEILGPFYIFQVFSLIIWSLDSYYYYASCIVIMSALSLTTSVVQTRRNQKQLRDTVQGIDMVNVCRTGDQYDSVESSQLVPGDIIEVPSFDCIMQCDAVLLSGNVIVNESMLTGESIPVTKTPLPNANIPFETKEHAKHTLFCGTKIIQTRYYNNAKVRALVIRTGYQTAKGELVRSIMFPKPVDFKLNRHIHKFVACLTVLSLVGFMYTVILKAKRGIKWTNILIKAFDLITIVIPPALPAAMTIGVVFAQSRLRAMKIFCISPRSINISGCINCVCFDKTGTLTEDDLNFAEVIPVNKAKKRFDKSIHSPDTDLEFSPLLINLAVCHSLTLIDGKIIGDPLDQKMFAATGWQLEEPEVSDTSKYDLLTPSIVKPSVDFEDKEVGILRQFPFSSSLQRMSVITRQINGHQFELYAKGSPEMIESLCDRETIPLDFTSRLQEYTEKGYRVLALAYRPLHMTYPKVQKAQREDLEKDMTFLGLLIMGNMLKPETKPVIETLIAANIRTLMVTGDNMLTALSVSRECSMIRPWHKVILLEVENGSDEEAKPTLCWKFANSAQHLPFNDNNLGPVRYEMRDKIHLALSGKTFQVLREHYPQLLNRVAVRGTIFARMSPEQKQQLIELLQELGFYVAMCGDGANDCGALKAAHAGVSLSEAEASVASPFTSKDPNISCIPTLIKEGRASIVTAFGILKYMACYSLTQFISVIILYTYYSNLTDKEFLYIDLALLTLFVALFGHNKAFKQLDREPPPSSLIGLAPLASIVLQIIIVIIIQCLSIVLVKRQSWYEPHVTHEEDNLASHDNYALFAASVFQYIALAVVFSKGRPYRQPLYTNKLFLLSLIVMTMVTALLVVVPPTFVANFFELYLVNVPCSFRLLMLGLAFVHFVLSLLVESFVVDYIIFKKCRGVERWFSGSKETSFKSLEKETFNNTRWLPNPPSNLPVSHTNSSFIA